MHQKIIILDFGSQYTQLIARRIRELNVYCEIHPWNKAPELGAEVAGVILSGSPFSVLDQSSPKPDLSKIKGKYPLLGVCFGAQFLAENYGGKVLPSSTREYGRAILSRVDNSHAISKGLTENSQVWMSHGDTIKTIPNNYKVFASTEEVDVAGFFVEDEKTFGVQFHPEVYHSTEGEILLKNFTIDICGCVGDWTPDSFVEETCAQLKSKIGDDRVILGLSGGVDSSVAAVLLHKAIGSNLHCIFVDNGLLRKNEYESVLASYHGMGLNVTGVKAYHSTEGEILLKNFTIDICGCVGDWTPDSFVEETCAQLKSKIGDDRVILGLSGGVDSSVAAVLLHKAIGSNLHCIFVDNGLLRKNEYESVLASYHGMGLNVTGVKASEEFYSALEGISDPELKRKAIGKVFIDVFEAESKKVKDAKWLGQGTIYPDVIESISATGGPSQTIKSHHNVGGLPDYMSLKVVEPLRKLFKDEVRRIGRSLDIDHAILGRHPFPGLTILHL